MQILLLPCNIVTSHSNAVTFSCDGIGKIFQIKPEKSVKNRYNFISSKIYFLSFIFTYIL